MIRLREIGSAKLQEVEKILVEVPKGASTAVARSLNRAIVAARTLAVKEARSEYQITSSALKQRTQIRRANIQRLNASFESEGPALSLLNFKISHTSPTNRPTVIKVAVKKGGMKPLPGRFVAIPNRGGLGTFKRTTTRGLPIARDYGPSIPQMIGAEAGMDKIERRAGEVLSVRLDHEMNRLLSR